MKWTCEKCGQLQETHEKNPFVCARCEDGKPAWYQMHASALRKFRLALCMANRPDLRLEEKFESAMEQAFLAGEKALADRLIRLLNQFGLSMGR